MSQFSHLIAIPYGDEVGNSFELFMSFENLRALSDTQRPFAAANQPLAAVTDGAWHHVVTTWDGSEICLYLDGALVECGAGAQTLLDGKPLLIGEDRNRGNPTNFFEGAIDEVCIYRRVLTADEIGGLAQRLDT